MGWRMTEMAREESQQGQDSQPAIGMNGLPKSHQPGDASESRYNGEATASQMRDRLATPHRPGDFLTMLIPMGRLPPWLATQTRDGLATPHHPGDLRKADANREAVALAWLPNEGLSCKSMTAMVTPLQALVVPCKLESNYWKSLQLSCNKSPHR
jgi:hypothetical protein